MNHLCYSRDEIEDGFYLNLTENLIKNATKDVYHVVKVGLIYIVIASNASMMTIIFILP